MNDTTANFRLRVSAWAVASSLALAALPLAAEAAGLGKITIFSALGQPLRAEMEVFATREELAGMRAQLASQDAFKQAGVDYAPALSGITLRLDKRANGQPIIRLTSTRPINDPFVDLLLELNWPSGRLIREYTFLLDPPEFAAKNAAAAPAIVRPLAEASPPLEDRPARASSRSRASEQVQKPVDGGATYEVKRGETLSKIASELRPEGVSLDQMLLGLFQANQNAFDGGDINRLKAGKILSVPDKATLETIPKGEARTVIVAQSSNWGTYRRKLATVAADAPGKEEGARQAAAGKVTTRVEDRGGPAAEPKDQLKVSKTDLPGSKSLPASKRTDEDLIAKEKALRDANERLASLERNVAELQRLVELKSQNLADLERQSAAKAVPATEAKKVPEVAASPTPAAAPPPARVEPAPAAVPAVPAKPLEPPVDVKPVEPVAKPETVGPKPEAVKAEVKAEVPPVAEPPKPVDLPKPKAVVPPPPAEEPGFIEELLNSTAFLAAGGIIIALLAAYWFAKRRRAGDGEAPLEDNSTLAPAVDENLAAKSVFRTTGGQTVDTTNSMPQTDFSQAGPGSIDTDEVDPVAEADVYMAYGRDAQAEEILLEAKQKDPRRHAIHLKLLEIYASRKDVKPFGVLATELFNATGGVGAEWEKAVAMGLQLDPRNPLFGSAGQQAEAVSEEAEAPATGTPESLRDTLTKPEQILAMTAAAGVAAGVAAERSAVGLAGEVQEARPEPVSLADLDFDFGSSKPRSAAPEVTDDAYLEATLAYPNPAKRDTLDFDLAASLPNAEPPPEEDRHDVQLVDDASSLEVTMLVAADSKPSAGLDFEFELGSDLPDEAGWDERTVTHAEPEQTFDIGSSDTEALEFDVALTESTVLGDAMQHAAFDMSSISLDLASDDAFNEAPTVLVSRSTGFSFEEEDQEDTLVNPDFAMEETDTGIESPLGSLTDSTLSPEITSSEEVATKIDLAKAYQEMGDLEGARELLREVVNEGDVAQRQEALNLLGGMRE